MDLLPDDEQAEVAAVSASFLADRLPAKRLMELEGSTETVDPSVWVEIAELGWFGLGLDESAGGVGYTLAEETLLFHQIGRQLGPTPLLASVLAAHACAASGDRERLAGLVGGELLAALALARPDGSADLLDADRADLLVRVDPTGASLLDAASVAQRAPMACVDDVVSLARAELDPAEVLVTVAGPDLWLRGAVLTAAMLSGIADASRDDAVAYALEREQFGKSIGTFQAIKHACADMAVRSEMAYTQVLYAALAVRDDIPGAAEQTAAAKVVAGESAAANSAADVQVHGGYGFTTEYLPQYFVKRAHVLDRCFGSARDHLDALVA